MKRELLITDDGSSTFFIAEMEVTYRSRRGAMQESMHVFINAGLKPLLHSQQTLRVFEMGFGTGLNALLTFKEAVTAKQAVYYYTAELFPLEKAAYQQLNYTQSEDTLLKEVFEKMHGCDWEADCTLPGNFTFHKTNTAVEDIATAEIFDLVYYDAFAPRAQPELWTVPIFEKIYQLLSPGGILVTYCSKGDVRRALLAAGFTVEKLQGPRGKREMLRAIRET